MRGPRDGGRGATALAAGAGLALLLISIAPRPAAARMQATFELGAGAAIPLAKYIDSSGPEGHNRVENGAHAAFALSLLFGNWQFRWSANWLSLGQQDFLIPEDSFNAYNQTAAQLGLPQLAQRRGTPELDDTLALHALTFGYRIYLLRGRWQPYIPIELGAAIVSSDSLSRTLYGVTAASGVGLDVRIWKFLYAGIGVRYNFYLTETDQSVAGLGLIASEDVFESTIAMAHVIAITAQIQGRY